MEHPEPSVLFRSHRRPCLIYVLVARFVLFRFRDGAREYQRGTARAETLSYA